MVCAPCPPGWPPDAPTACVSGLKFDRGNRVRVEATLGVTGKNGRSIDGLFAIGDCAACYEVGAAKLTPATAQAAHQQAMRRTRGDRT